MEFLDLIESFRAGDATRERLYGGDGTGVRMAQRGPQFQARLAEAASLLAGVFSGKTPAYRLQEAMTTSDFPLLFGNIMDRMVLANYQEAPAVYRNFCKVGSVRDFRAVERYGVSGAEGVLDAVAEQAPYPASKLDEAKYTWGVKKYGRRLPFSWEAMVNDDLDALKDIPARFGRAARRSESKFATTLYAGASGPHSSLYTVGNKNIVTGNPALSIASLQTAMTLLASQVDADGEPIVIEAVELVVPPALEITALNILNSTEILINEAGGTSNQQMRANNWMRNRLRLSVDPYHPLVASTANGSSSWYLFANPDSGRPVIEIDFLRGHEAPEIFMKAPNATRVGGGGVDPMNGDFDTDSLEYKIRHVFGGGRIDPKGTVASNGSGS